MNIPYIVIEWQSPDYQTGEREVDRIWGPFKSEAAAESFGVEKLRHDGRDCCWDKMPLLAPPE